MRVNSVKQWYEYEADLNRILKISVYPGDRSPNKFIIDLTVKSPDSIGGSFNQYIYEHKNKKKEFSLKSLTMVINTICAVQVDPPATFFLEQKDETSKNG